MRRVFLIVLLAGAIYYSYVAFADLNFLTRTGRPGPGFFPRLIGISATLMLLWVLFDELRSPENQGERPELDQWRDAIILIVLSLGYAVLLRLFGGFIATVLFLLAALMILNKGQIVKNAILSMVIPAGVYLLFDKVLNANMPPALYELPI